MSWIAPGPSCDDRPKSKSAAETVTDPEASALVQLQYINPGWGSTTPEEGIAAVSFKVGDCEDAYDLGHDPMGWLAAGPSCPKEGGDKGGPSENKGAEPEAPLEAENV